MKIKPTNDGSDSLYSETYHEHYHSTHGALSESLHVFINEGLKKNPAKKISIFEMGFGTGLNCLLTVLETQNQDIFYHSIETNPLSTTLITELNYTKLLNINPHIFITLHDLSWNEEHKITPTFTLYKEQISIENIALTRPYDLIYYDAFSPFSQPELWTENIFRKLYQHLAPGGIFVTYCAKGDVKRTLKKSGFLVETCPGPPGKREMIRARKK